MLVGTATSCRSGPVKPCVQRLFGERQSDVSMLVTRPRHGFVTCSLGCYASFSPVHCNVPTSGNQSATLKIVKTEISSELFCLSFVDTRAVRANEELRVNKLFNGQALSSVFGERFEAESGELWLANSNRRYCALARLC